MTRRHAHDGLDVDAVVFEAVVGRIEVAEAEGEEKYSILTPEELGRYHAGKEIAAPKCWVCGHGTWFIQSDENRPLNGSHWYSPKGVQSESIFQTAFLSCEKCGTIWAIDYEMVKRWLKENPV